MTEIPSDLAAAGRLAGMHDTGDLALLDLGALPRDISGRITGARDVVEALRKAKPNLFRASKLAKDMTPAERQDAIRAASSAANRGSDTGPLPHADKHVSEMNAKEHAEFVREYRRKFPDVATSQSLSAPRKSFY